MKSPFDPSFNEVTAFKISSILSKHDRVLVATVGLPRSGKSTWALQQGYPIVCPDQIRLSLHGQAFYALAEPMVWAIAKVMVRSLFGSGHKLVILDATNTSRDRRNEWKSHSWALYFKQITTDVEECKKRAPPELLPVIDRMSAQFEPLDDVVEHLWPG